MAQTNNNNEYSTNITEEIETKYTPCYLHQLF